MKIYKLFTPRLENFILKVFNVIKSTKAGVVYLLSSYQILKEVSFRIESKEVMVVNWPTERAFQGENSQM